MSLNVDMRVLQLLCSRLCHDLVGPVGAVTNGVEMVEEFDASMADEAMRLIGESAGQAASRLQFFRYAYGRVGKPISGDELASLLRGVFEGDSTTLEWPKGITSELLDGLRGKLVANMAALMADALPRGGRIVVEFSPTGSQVRMRAEGPSASLPDNVVSALAIDHDPDALNARSVQAFFTALVASATGGSLTLQQADPGSLSLTAEGV